LSAALVERINAIRAEADAFLDEQARALSETSTNVPFQVLRNLLTSRACGCQCRAVLNNLDDRSPDV
jgi:hypothetical protein